jgi:hypothetical protein
MLGSLVPLCSLPTLGPSIDIRYHFIRDVITKGQVIVDYIPTAHQPTDVLTKALGPQLHQWCADGMDLRVYVNSLSVWRTDKFGRCLKSFSKEVF